MYWTWVKASLNFQTSRFKIVFIDREPTRIFGLHICQCHYASSWHARQKIVPRNYFQKSRKVSLTILKSLQGDVLSRCRTDFLKVLEEINTLICSTFYRTFFPDHLGPGLERLVLSRCQLDNKMKSHHVGVLKLTG